LKNGDFGEVYYGYTHYLRSLGGIPAGAGNWFINKAKSGGGALIDNGVHLLDINWYLMGCPNPVSAFGGEANLYWLWRMHWSGQELMHGAVVSSHGRPLHIFGEGQVILLGTLPTPEELPGLLRSIAKEAGIGPIAQASENIYVIPREGKAGKGLIVVEHENRPATLVLSGKMTDLITRKVHTGTVALKPYAVMVLSA